MIDRATKLTVTLDAASWDAVLNLLAEGPYRLAAPLIADIQRQCVAPSPRPDHPYTSPVPHGNGEAADMSVRE